MPTEDSQRNPMPADPDSSALEDERLIAEATAPPALDEARESLAFWEKRLAGLQVYERAERREAKEMVERSRQRLREAERASNGPSLLDQLVESAGINRLPVRQLVSVAKKALAIATVMLVLLVVVTIAFWSEIEPVLSDLIRLGAGEGGD